MFPTFIFLQVRGAASHRIEVITDATSNFGKGVKKSMKNCTKEAKELLQSVGEFIDIEDIVKTFQKFRHPEIFEQRNAANVVHTTIDWTMFPPNRWRMEESHIFIPQMEDGVDGMDTTMGGYCNEGENTNVVMEHEEWTKTSKLHDTVERNCCEDISRHNAVRNQYRRNTANELRWDLLTTDTRKLRIDDLTSNFTSGNQGFSSDKRMYLQPNISDESRQLKSHFPHVSTSKRTSLKPDFTHQRAVFDYEREFPRTRSASVRFQQHPTHNDSYCNSYMSSGEHNDSYCSSYDSSRDDIPSKRSRSKSVHIGNIDSRWDEVQSNSISPRKPSHVQKSYSLPCERLSDRRSVYMSSRSSSMPVTEVWS